MIGNPRQIPWQVFGYTSGSGAAVTQSTNKGTGVTINARCGQITMNNANLPANTAVAFTVTNSECETTDIPVIAIDSVGTLGAYHAGVGAVGAGSFGIVLQEIGGSDRAQAVVLNFAIIKGAAT
jgi:hypothetical protein